MHAVASMDSGDAGSATPDAASQPELDAAASQPSQSPQLDAAAVMTPTPVADSGKPDQDARTQLDAGGGTVVVEPEPKHEADASMPAVCPQAQAAKQVKVSAYEAGALVIPSFTANRAGVTSAMVGQRVVWLFNMVDAQMAGWGSVQSLLSSPPHLDEPGPFVPLFPVGTVPDGYQVSIGSALALNDREALIFFASSRWFATGQPGLARIAVDQPAAQIVRAAGALFTEAVVPDGGTAPWQPIFMTGAVAADEPDGTYVYVYGCQADPDVMAEQSGGAQASPCRVARVPSANVSFGASYRFWNGKTWGVDVHKASVVMTGVTSPLSVSYNKYLGKYLAVHTLLVNTVALQIADRPEGPWKLLSKFPTMESTVAFRTTVNAVEHPELRDACQQVTYISYVKPWSSTPDAGIADLHYDTRLVRLQFE